MATKKDYEMIAGVIRTARHITGRKRGLKIQEFDAALTWTMVEEFCKELKADNEAFNEEKFKQACRLPWERQSARP